MLNAHGLVSKVTDGEEDSCSQVGICFVPFFFASPHMTRIWVDSGVSQCRSNTLSDHVQGISGGADAKPLRVDGPLPPQSHRGARMHGKVQNPWTGSWTTELSCVRFLLDGTLRTVQ